MNKDINLAGTIKKRRLPDHKVALFRRAAIIIAIVTTIFSILVFIISIQYSLSLAQSEQEKVNSRLTSYQKKIAEARLLKDRLGQIRTVTVGRENSFSQISEIISKKPEAVTTDSIDLGENSLIISFKSTSLSPMKDFITAIKEIKIAQGRQIKISELKTAPEGYTLSLYVKGL